ncbi:MAG TPA: dTDP-4-dehydrorhamnose 3,5-epimerase [Myxococcota bacterium]|nr:dTDP-4-dehydrorhamnose 3,5-epimerase [Myxococcota bacterium]
MIFKETGLPGAWLIELERVEDGRGFFARSFCAREFAERGLAARFVQSSVSFNARAGTLRGMHFQLPPHREVKLVRCTAGAVFDAIVDLRTGSPTRLRWFGTELDAANRRMLYIPEGFAHGFLTLAPDTEVFYEMSEFYAPQAGRGLRWSDPALGIRWPAAPTVIAERDAGYPDLDLSALAEVGP